MKFDIDPTQEDILKSFIFLSIPMMLEMAAQNLFNLVDTYFVSRISYAAIGALVTAGILNMVFVSVVVGVSSGTGIYVASLWGAKRHIEARRFYSNAVLLALFLGIFSTAVVLAFLSHILHLVSLKGATFKYAREYMSVMAFGFVPNFLFFVNNAAIRAVALPSVALKVMVVVNMLNAVLDPLFIFGLSMGIKGAALATVVSMVAGIVFQLVLFKKNEFGFLGLVPDPSILKSIVRKGFFAFLQLFFRITSMLFIIRIIGEISQAAVSAYGAVIRIFQVLLFAVFGMGNAAFVVVGQNYGAGFIERVKKGAFTALVVAVLFVGFLDLLLYIFRYPVVSLFIGDSRVKSIALDLIRFYSFSYPFVVLSVISSRVSMALKDTERPSLVNLVNLWFFNVPLAYFLSLHMGERGVWIAIAASNFTSFVLSYAVMRLNLKRVEKES